MPLKATKRRVSVSSDSSSSLDLSDDEGYSAVEDLSESEDDEDNVMAAEEEHLLTRASRKRPLDNTPRPQVIAQEEDQDADEEDEEEEDQYEQNEDGDDEDEDDDEPEDDDDNNPTDENESWGGLSEPEEATLIEQVPEPSIETEVSVKRHVRFAGIPDDESDSDSTTTETESNADLFPDIFVDRNELDPGFRCEIERGNESSSAESFWDYDGNPQEFFMDSEDEVQIPQNMLLGASLLPNLTVPIPTITPELPDSALSKAQEMELDGYESESIQSFRTLCGTNSSQRTAKQQKKRIPSPSFGRSRQYVLSPRLCLQSPRLIGHRGRNGANLAWAVFTWTDPRTSRSLSSTPILARS